MRAVGRFHRRERVSSGAEPPVAAPPEDAGLGVPAGDTVAEWLRTVRPAPPPALLQRLGELLAPYAHQPAREAPSACIAAGTERLRTLLAEGATDRASALDLLTVDALVTYAFEAAVLEPDRLESLADDAMARIAEIPETT